MDTNFEFKIGMKFTSEAIQHIMYMDLLRDLESANDKNITLERKENYEHVIFCVVVRASATFLLLKREGLKSP